MSIFEKVYNRINWQNKPSTETPINADNLNKMDKAIYDLDDRVVSLSESVNANTTDISTLKSDVSANSVKLATIDDGANKTVVDSVLSSTSTNPVQNNVITEELGKKTGIHSFIGQLAFSNGMAQWVMGVHSGITHVTNVISVCGWGSDYAMSFSVADANVSNFSIYVFASNGSGIANGVLSFKCFYTID